MSHTVAVDIGGTSIKGALVTPVGLGPMSRRPTPTSDPTGEQTADAVADLVGEVTSGTIPAVVGLVAPGIVDENAGVVLQSVNLGWVDVPIRDLVAAATGSLVAFGHDVRSGALAERAALSDTDPGEMLFVPIGTGISLAALDADGTPIGNAWSGEIGTFRAFGHDRRSTLEDVASAAGLARATGQATGEAVAEAVRRGESVAVAAWMQGLSSLAEALAWASIILSPQTIVIGGGLSHSGPLLFSTLTDHLEILMEGHRIPRVVPATLGDTAACVGAGMLATALEASR